VPLSLPQDFELIGSSVAGSTMRVAWKTDLHPDAASAVAVRALQDKGWRDISGSHPMFRRGFQSAATPRTSTLCRDADAGSVAVHAWANSGRTLLSLMRFDGDQTCNAPAQDRYRDFLTGAMDALPALNLPDSARTISNGSGSSGAESYASAVIATTMTRAALLSYFGDQVRTQGWTYDTGRTGNLVSGAQWVKSAEDDDTLVGTLSVLDAGQETYNVRFAVMSVGSAVDGDSGVSTVTFGPSGIRARRFR
jgi:hypothetical protein